MIEFGYPNSYTETTDLARLFRIFLEFVFFSKNTFFVFLTTQFRLFLGAFFSARDAHISALHIGIHFFEKNSKIVFFTVANQIRIRAADLGTLRSLICIQKPSILRRLQRRLPARRCRGCWTGKHSGEGLYGSYT